MNPTIKRKHQDLLRLVKQAGVKIRPNILEDIRPSFALGELLDKLRVLSRAQHCEAIVSVCLLVGLICLFIALLVGFGCSSVTLFVRCLIGPLVSVCLCVWSIGRLAVCWLVVVVCSICQHNVCLVVLSVVCLLIWLFTVRLFVSDDGRVLVHALC